MGHNEDLYEDAEDDEGEEGSQNNNQGGLMNYFN